MSAKEESKFISTLWRNLKRALVSVPDIQNGETSFIDTAQIQGSNNASNYSNNSVLEPTLIADVHLEKNSKRQRLNLAIDQVGISEQNSFMEVMKNLLSCSICLEVNNYSNQCPNGHLICTTCSGRLQQSSGELNCPVCRVSLKQGLHRSLLAEQLTSELPATCRYCEAVMPVKYVKKHETEQCCKRIVPCEYKLFGCVWTGIKEDLDDHVDVCPIATETVGELHDTVNENVSKDFNLLQVPLQLWKSIVSKIRIQAVGSRIIIRQTALNKTVGDDVFQFIYKSPLIRVPFSCCQMHGFYLEIGVSKNEGTTEEKLFYTLKSENRTKIFLNYFITSIKVDENVNLDIQDTLRCHQFESNHKESNVHEIKLISLDCDKVTPKLTDFESFFVEICLISERERSERGHGVLNPNEEDDTNGFISTNGTDNNVVFTLFSPTNNASRSINTSNTLVTNNIDDSNIMNDVEPSHEDDIVITVTENADGVDEISMENREHYTSRNNHSYVAVPNVFLNPNASVFTYSPFQLDNTFINTNYQPPTRQNQEHLYYENDNQNITPEQDLLRQSTNNFNRILRPNETMTAEANNSVLEPIRMSLFYPSQTIVAPYITNSVSPIAVRPTIAPVNVLIRSRPSLGQVPLGLPVSTDIIDQQQLQQDIETLINNVTVDETIFRNDDRNYISTPVLQLSDSDSSVNEPVDEIDQNNINTNELSLQQYDLSIDERLIENINQNNFKISESELSVNEEIYVDNDQNCFKAIELPLTEFDSTGDYQFNESDDQYNLNTNEALLLQSDSLIPQIDDQNITGELPLSESDQNYHFSYSEFSHESIYLEDSNLPEDIEE